ncbi:MAG: hypothetical protein ABIO72_03015 [Patescibacteria group bacterium]
MADTSKVIFQDRAYSILGLIIGFIALGAAVGILIPVLRGQPGGNNPLVGAAVCGVVGLAALSSVVKTVTLTEKRFKFGSFYLLYSSQQLITDIATPKLKADKTAKVTIKVPGTGEEKDVYWSGLLPKKWLSAPRSILFIGKFGDEHYLFPHPKAEQLAKMIKAQTKTPPV